MNTNLIALNFGNSLANILLNLSFIATIVILLILFFRMISRDNGNLNITVYSIRFCYVFRASHSSNNSFRLNTRGNWRKYT